MASPMFGIANGSGGRHERDARLFQKTRRVKNYKLARSINKPIVFESHMSSIRIEEVTK